jgi:PadR family transcriptional regulator AphA
MPRAVSIRHLILGLLTQQPMSGYDIRRFLKSLSWLIESPSFGTIYPSLRVLREDGLVTMEIISNQDKPPRKIYTITEPGRQALQEWADQPLVPDASLKAFVMRLILANSLSPTGLIAHLQQRRSQVATHYATLKQLAEATDGMMDDARHIAFDYSLALAGAELTWLESALEQLSQQPLPMEVVEATT